MFGKMFGGDRFEDLIGQISIGESLLPSERASAASARGRSSSERAEPAGTAADEAGCHHSLLPPRYFHPRNNCPALALTALPLVLRDSCIADQGSLANAPPTLGKDMKDAFQQQHESEQNNDYMIGPKGNMVMTPEATQRKQARDRANAEAVSSLRGQSTVDPQVGRSAYRWQPLN